MTMYELEIIEFDDDISNFDHIVFYEEGCYNLPIKVIQL